MESRGGAGEHPCTEFLSRQVDSTSTAVARILKQFMKMAAITVVPDTMAFITYMDTNTIA